MANDDDSDSGSKASTAKSLNEENWPGLLAITALNLVVFAVVVGVGPTPFSDLATAWAFLLPAGVGLAMIRVINGLIDVKNKNRLVFWKRENPLPGSQAYSVYAKNDDRFTYDDVIRKLYAGLKEKDEERELKDIEEILELKEIKEIMENPSKQNAHWYSTVYHPNQDTPKVRQANRDFLFTCDYAAISFVTLIAFGIVGNLSIILAGYCYASSSIKHSISIGILYFAGLALQYGLALLAARNYAIATVTNALAAWLQAPAASVAPERDWNA
jgi:hypothetical protein